MAIPETGSITPFRYGSVLKSWWQTVLVAVIGVSVLIGAAIILLIALDKLRKSLRNRNSALVLPQEIARFLQSSLKIEPSLRAHSTRRLKKPSTFDVYLGPISNPPSEDETRVLSQSDLIILEPYEKGVLDTLSTSRIPRAARVVARYDFRKHMTTEPDKEGGFKVGNRVSVEFVKSFLQAVGFSIKKPGEESPFSGILLAGWEDTVLFPLLMGLAQFFGDLGLEVYLEVAPPQFLDDVQQLDLSPFDGVVVRNATVLADGESRDYFAMGKMASTVKAFVSQSCLRDFTVMMWETVDDQAEMSLAVLRRSFGWCSYHDAVVWTNPAMALVDASQNVRVDEPLGAFRWLKEQKVMEYHETYRNTRLLSSRAVSHAADYREMLELVPSLQSIVSALRSGSQSDAMSTITTITLQSQNEEPEIDWRGIVSDETERTALLDQQKALEWVARMEQSPINALSVSHLGADFTSFGCFPLGIDVTKEDFKKIVKSQTRLQRLELLDRVGADDVVSLGERLNAFLASEPSSKLSPSVRRFIRDLSDGLSKASDSDPTGDPVQIFRGLNSGFQVGADTEAQFWAVYEDDRRSGGLVIYVSNNAPDLLSTVVHTYLSSKNVLRYNCFLTEASLHEYVAPSSREPLPPRLLQDLRILTPADILLFLQHLKFSYSNLDCHLLSAIYRTCEEILLDIPSYKQLKELGNVDYLKGTIQVPALVSARVSWYKQHGCVHLDLPTCIQIFEEVDVAFQFALKHRRYDCLNIFTNTLSSLLGPTKGQELGSIDCYADIVAFSIFCVARKFAFDEVFIEVSDRNPLFNEFSDQSAAFAELFALGSRCDAYFDITPNEMGKLLSEKHRAHYMLPENQPPVQVDNAPSFATVYAAAESDIDKDQVHETLPGYQRFTFLSVFAIPALVDIILLTTTGRGLYLSKYMQQDEKENATLALLVSLLLSGAIGTWIAMGGTYYLISMAFSAANMFVLTRLVGGLSITILGGVIGLIIIGILENFKAGVIFFCYLLILTAYLTVLAALSIYQFPGSSFLNGRIVIITILPTLMIAPIVTSFVSQYNTLIYILLLFFFISLLFIGLRRVVAQWVTWCSKVKTVDDATVKKWYIDNRANGNDKVFHGLTAPAAMNLSRQNLNDAVERERRRGFWRKSSADNLVRELAQSWEATVFLLNWYCRLTSVKRPRPYSSTWNIEVRVAFDSLQQNQKAIRLHNSFLHWRNSGDEIGCGVLYFIVALLDRWIELFFGGPVVGLGLIGSNDAFSVATGFGLAYYLIGAVLLDYKAQHLHQQSQETIPLSISSPEMIHDAKTRDARVKRKLYWSTLGKFLGVHVWTLALCSALVWIFASENGYEAVVMFLAYTGAYSGLLWYQYNKIFSGPHAVMPLFTATLLGLPAGCLLRHFKSSFVYTPVISLAFATWVAAITSIYTAKIGLPKRRSSSKRRRDFVFHAYRDPGVDQQWSQTELEAFYEMVMDSPSKSRFKIKADGHPGVEIQTLLLSCNQESLSSTCLEAFPTGPEIVEIIVKKWRDGDIVIELAQMKSVLPQGCEISAISAFHEGRLHLIVSSDGGPTSGRQPNITSNCRAIVEMLLHVGGVSYFGLRHEYATILESLLVCKLNSESHITESLKRSLSTDTSTGEVAALANVSRKTLLRNLCLGLQIETAWDLLPLDIRRALLNRCMGDFGSFSAAEILWLQSNTDAEESCLLNTRLARYDLGAILAVSNYNYFKRAGPIHNGKKVYQQAPDIQFIGPTGDLEKPFLSRALSNLRKPIAFIFRVLGTCIKFFVIAPMADLEYQRELDCTLQGVFPVFSKPAVWFLTSFWQYSRAIQRFVLPFYLLHDREDLVVLWHDIKGTMLTLKSKRLTVRSNNKTFTGFIHKDSKGGFELYQYDGSHTSEPGKSKVVSIGKYAKDTKLLSRQEFENGECVNEFVYEYATKSHANPGKLTKQGHSKIPLCRICVRGSDESSVVQYNNKGFLTSGSYMLSSNNLVRFKYHYRKNAKFTDKLLRAEFILPHLSVNVSWAAPPIRHPHKTDRWIPHSRVREATFVQGSDVYECIWIYNHQYHPTIMTKLNGQQVDTPDMIRFDWLRLLKKPTRCTFISDNPLGQFTSLHYGFFHRLFRMNVQRHPVSTSAMRSQLWKSWKASVEIDGVVVRWLDEQLLRDDPILRPYWRKRDRGALVKAEDYLALNADTVTASAELTNDISAWTPLAIRMGDLFSFGQGGDAVVYTRTKALQPDTEDTLHVVASDTGTWPNEGGGVSACRRDLINNLKSIRWHMVVESANDFGLPKHQTEENVESLKVIPLWGLDFMAPIHGMFFNKLDSEVDQLTIESTRDDIKRNFVPTLTALVRGARAVRITPAHVKQATRALVNLNTYFQDSRHWKEVWTSDIVKDAWRNLWLESIPNAKPPSEWFDTEYPTIGHFDSALDLWFRYLFIFSIPIPERIPAIFQASHHSVSASYGIVCKIKRNCTLQIWDHAISWRETNLYLSSALCTLPPFIRNSLLGLMRLTSMLILHHADVILPCTDTFNPGWEIEIGTSQGGIEHRNKFRRKIDPVVNGITDMHKFAPVTEITTKKPTVTMLSHLWLAKDIKTALLAADIIINKWGFDDYVLDIYGALNKAPIYSSECQELIATKGLAPQVTLRGTADPTKVLATTWLFLNSSVSEGLPLALGEAALTGAPVVATDVGASLRVLTDPDTGERYSEVVAPNDPYSLARAQVNILAMLGEWSKFADDNPNEPAPALPFEPTPEDVKRITQRMYDKSDHRRALGMKARTIVQKSFSGARYLREHEQMLWIGKARWEALDLEILPAVSATMEQKSDKQLEKMAHPKTPWLRGRDRASGATSFTSIYSELNVQSSRQS
ncbi:hypothetical protein P152DRAFT_417112, partial [Eremomyces bilateralis CBS 781.70]